MTPLNPVLNPEQQPCVDKRKLVEQKLQTMQRLVHMMGKLRELARLKQAMVKGRQAAGIQACHLSRLTWRAASKVGTMLIPSHCIRQHWKVI